MVFIGVALGIGFTVLWGLGTWAVIEGGISNFQKRLAYGTIIGMGVFALVGAVLHTILELNG